METTTAAAKKALLAIFRGARTLNQVAAIINISKPGAWKIIQHLKKEEYLSVNKLGGKTSTALLELLWTPRTRKALELYLLEEARAYTRWQHAFKDLKAEFVLLFGSTLANPKNARDIDILYVSKDFQHTRKQLEKIQQTQIKTIHALGFTKAEIEFDNPAIRNALQGVVLSGHEAFVEFMHARPRLF